VNEHERAPAARAPAKAGAAVDFEELFARYRERVLRLCLHVVGEPHAAEDALQETFLAVYRGLPRFRGDSDVGTWIYRIAVRSSLRLAARRKRRERTLAGLEVAATPATTASDTADLRTACRRAMAALPVELRVVLQLAAVEELTAAEIARILGIPVGTVWSRLHRARKELARRLPGGES
jgi:RNA polymerase sigma-70 factor (ECF subfamily)